MGTYGAGRVGMTEMVLNNRADEPVVGIGARVLIWATQLFCGLHGHSHLRRFEKRRMFLECASCGHESPGWTLPNSSPKLRAHVDARPHRLVPRPRLGDARRIA